MGEQVTLDVLIEQARRSLERIKEALATYSKMAFQSQARGQDGVEDLAIRQIIPDLDQNNSLEVRLQTFVLPEDIRVAVYRTWANEAASALRAAVDAHVAITAQLSQIVSQVPVKKEAA